MEAIIMPYREDEYYTVKDTDTLRWDCKHKLWVTQCKKCDKWFVPNQTHPSFEHYCSKCLLIRF